MGRFSVDDDSDDEASIPQENTLDLRREECLPSQSFGFANNNDNDTYPIHSQFNENENVAVGNPFSGRDIYFSDDPNQYAMVQDKRSRSYWRHMLLVIFLIILQHYAPPPVPPFDSWREYISHSMEGFGSTVTNLIALGYYIGSGCFNNMKQDGVGKINAMLSRKDEISIPCPIDVPKENESFDAIQSIRDQMVQNIVGQYSAMDSISKALAAWDIPPFGTNSGKQPTRTKPMNMIFAGPDGVGKYETAQEVAKLLLNACQDDIFKNHMNYDNPSCTCNPEENKGRILKLQGIDFALKDDSKKSFIRQILEHVHSYSGAGAVIVIQHVEHLSLDAKLELVRLLSKPSVSFIPSPIISKTTSFWNTFNVDEQSQNTKEHVDIRLDNCVFLLTTDLGTDKIFGGLRSYGLKDVALFNEVHKAVEQDAVSHFSGVELFHAVVPFWPLQYSDMKVILKRKLAAKSESQRYSIEVGDSALEYLAGPNHIDYIEMKFAGWLNEDGENTGSIIFAERGGHDLLHESVIKAVEEKLKDDSFHNADEFVRLGYDGSGQMKLQLCSRESTQHVNCIERGIITM